MNAYRGGPATLQRVGIRRIPAIVQSKPVPPILLQSQRRRAAFAAATGTCQCLRSLPARRPSSPVDGVSARGASADVDWHCVAHRATCGRPWHGRRARASIESRARAARPRAPVPTVRAHPLARLAPWPSPARQAGRRLQRGWEPFRQHACGAACRAAACGTCR